MIDLIFKFMSSYVILVFGFIIIKFSIFFKFRGEKNIGTILITSLGIGVVAYSFIKFGIESVSYIRNILGQILTKNIIDKIILFRIIVPMLIFIILSFILVKLSAIYEKKGNKYLCSMIITSSVLSLLGTLVILFSVCVASLHYIFSLI